VKQTGARVTLPTPGAGDRQRVGEVESLRWFFEIGHACGEPPSNFARMVAACAAQKDGGAKRGGDEKWTTTVRPSGGRHGGASPDPDWQAVADAARAAPIRRALAQLSRREQSILLRAFGPLRGPALPSLGDLSALALDVPLAREIHAVSRSDRPFADWLVRLARGRSALAVRFTADIRSEAERMRAGALAAYRRAALRWQEVERERASLRAAARRALERAGVVLEEETEERR